ncbi:hypothetical protein S40288_06832 [Stachybotrys chartarum IBT 40288]|nr:hypothetical protein S40288_06832 [Stachybotrys chartarum IBT 40288]
MSDRSSTGESGSIYYDDQEIIPDNGLKIETAPFGLEKLYDYEPGGHHPVHLDDVFNNRYRVIHKLGSGGFANVWLCRDLAAGLPKYVAAKVIAAEGSTAECPESRVDKLLETGCEREATAIYFSLPLDQFEIHGPNGTHYVFVYPVLGPRVSKLLHLSRLDDPGPQLRKICLQIAQAMATLHAHGICHGDFRPANILARIRGFDGLSEETVLEILGRPETTKVILVSGETHTLKTAPQYLIYPVKWDEVLLNPNNTSLTTGSACLTDFGESFESSSPPVEVGIPQVYYSPEQALEGKVGEASDLWALGCTLFEVRTGRKLFDTFDGDVDECLCKIALLLGKYPEPWWSETWASRRHFFQDEGDGDGKVVKVPRKPSTGNRTDAPQFHRPVYERPIPRSLEEIIREGAIFDVNKGPHVVVKDITTQESKIFADLLGRILNYNPKKRLSAEEVGQHEWFKL